MGHLERESCSEPVGLRELYGSGVWGPLGPILLIILLDDDYLMNGLLILILHSLNSCLSLVFAVAFTWLEIRCNVKVHANILKRF